MKPKILLINPWIYDFAAVSLWSRPLGLLRAAELLSLFDVKLSLIDCTNAFSKRSFGKGKYLKETVEKPASLRSIPRRFGRYGMPVDEFRRELMKHAPFDMVFMTSIMSWWYPGVQKAVEIVRSVYGDVPVVLGGIYATLWSRHASETSGADFIYRGQISEDISFVFNTFGFRVKRREAQKNFKSLYPYYKLGLYDDYPFAPVLTGTGCPYACSYCGSRLLSDGFFRRDPGEVVKEIMELRSMGVRDFAFYDDALLANADSHIKIILKEIIRHTSDIRFHCPNGLHARLIDDELALLMKQSGFSTLRLGLETVDEDRRESTGGKVTPEDLIRAVRNLKKHGFSKKDLGVYLMYGLPGQGLDEVRDGVAFLKGLGVRINLTEFSPIPGTKCWDDLIDKGVMSDDIDPLLTNNSIFSYLFSGYDRDRLEELKLEVKAYNIS